MRRTFLILVFTAGLAGLLLVAKTLAGRDRTEKRVNEGLLRPFQNEGIPSRADYEGLAIYFMQGFEKNKNPLGAGADYPGMPSEHGRKVDELEGFARMAPLWASWVASGRPDQVELGGGAIDLSESFRRGLLAGTNPQSKEYWGAISDSDQRIVEASDVALALWLLRNRVWKRLSEAEKRQVVVWLDQVNGKHVPDNNWHLFVIFVDAVLNKLAGVDHDAEMRKHYAQVRSFYRGEGWFSDGPGQVFDYYNAWGFHYQLFWLQQVDPQWDPSFIHQARAEFVKSYQYFFTPAGFPIMGRSVCYRMAAPAPLILNQLDAEHIAPGEARRALDTTWQYFLRHGGARNGNITQGYCGSDARVLDNYSGPASCLWSLRSLIAALYLPESAGFWTAKPRKLAVERGDFEESIKATRWKLVGTRSTGEVTIHMPEGRAATPLDSYTREEQVNAERTGYPSRPDNHAAKYERSSYSSAQPFCGCD